MDDRSLAVDSRPRAFVEFGRSGVIACVVVGWWVCLAAMAGAEDDRSRAEELLANMTLAEKAAQLSSAFHQQLIRPNGTLHTDAGPIVENGLGSVSRLTAWGGRSAAEAAEIGRALQEYLIESTRSGVPALIHEEALSGLAARDATVYPQALTLAATFNPQLVREIADRIREEMVACGIRQALSPVLDVVRDPRWGRTEETFGEDPYLVAALGVAFVEGLQYGTGSSNGPRSIEQGVAATLKHFAGHGVPEGGRNAAPVHIGPRAFRETFLFPFEAAVRAGARGVMCAYHDRDGVPAAIDRTLLSEILREEWGFGGVVVSDYGSLHRLMTDHRVASNPIHAGILALIAGVDVELPQTQCYGANLVTAVESSFLPVDVLDQAVLRVLRLKEELGLLDDGWQPGPTPVGGWDGPDRRALAKKAAHEGIVLLKNDGVLPLSGRESVFLCGPAADASLALVGDYSYPFAIQEGGVSIPTLRESLREALRESSDGRATAGASRGTSGTFAYAPGSTLLSMTPQDFGAVATGARGADVVVVALGDRSSKDESLSGEHRDRSQLRLPQSQAALLDIALSSRKPVVCVLASGRPVAEPERFARCAAILHVGFPGEEGAPALVDLLYGKVSPSGRTPISWPRSVGQIPVDYRRHPTSWGEYVSDHESEDASAAKTNAGKEEVAENDRTQSSPLFAFGHGLSYTEFEYSDLRIDPPRVEGDATVQVSCVVANTGTRDADEVVQLYVRDPVASTVRPALELKGFVRTAIGAGDAVRVRFSLPVDQLSLIDARMKRIVEPGNYQVWIGRSSTDRPLSGEFEVGGRARDVGVDRAMFGGTQVTPIE